MQTKKWLISSILPWTFEQEAINPTKSLMTASTNYIHKESNHPPAIINNLPKGIEFRLSNNSSDSKLFEEAVKPYNRALKENGHRKELKFTTSPKITDRTNHDPKDPRDNEPKKKIRRRNITWFNPPFSKNVATNVGNKFFTLFIFMLSTK